MNNLKKHMNDYLHTLDHIKYDKPATRYHQTHRIEHDYRHQEVDLFHFQPMENLLLAGDFLDYHGGSSLISICKVGKSFHVRLLEFIHP